MGGCACRDCRRGLDDAERKKRYDCDVTQGSTSTAAAATNAMKVSTLTAAKPYSHLTLLAALQSWVIARWTAVRVRGLTRGGYLEQVRGYCREPVRRA